MRRFLRRTRKAVGALLGALTAQMIMTALGFVGFDVPFEVAAALDTLAAALGAFLAPKNEE